MQHFVRISIAIILSGTPMLMANKTCGPLTYQVAQWIIDRKPVDFTKYLTKPPARETNIKSLKNTNNIITTVITETITYPDKRTNESDIKKANKLLKKNTGFSLLHLLSYFGDKEAIKTLLEVFPNGLQETDDRGNTPLYSAITKNDAVLVKYFILGQRYFEKASMNHHNDKGYSPLWYAITICADKVVEELLMNGFFCDNTKNNYDTYLQYANEKFQQSATSESKRIIELLEEESNLIGAIKKYFIGNRKEFSKESISSLLLNYLNNNPDITTILKAEAIVIQYRNQTFGDILAHYFTKLGEEKCNRYMLLIESKQDLEDKEYKEFIKVYLVTIKLNKLGYAKKSSENSPIQNGDDNISMGSND